MALRDRREAVTTTPLLVPAERGEGLKKAMLSQHLAGSFEFEH